MVYLNVVGFLALRAEFAPVHYRQVGASEDYAVFLHFHLLGINFSFCRIFGLLYFIFDWLVAAISRFALCSSSASISAMCSQLCLFGREGANIVLWEWGSYRLRKVPGLDNAFRCSTSVLDSGLLFLFCIFLMISCRTPVIKSFSVHFSNFRIISLFQ